MIQKNLYIEEYTAAKQQDVRALLSQMLQGSDISISVHLHYFHIPITKAHLNNFADLIASVGAEHEFTIDLIVETDQWKAIRRLRKTLNQYAMDVHLYVSDRFKPEKIRKFTRKMLLEQIVITCDRYESFLAAYDEWKTVGLPIELRGYKLTPAEYQEFFTRWSQDPDAVWFLPYQDQITYILSGVHTDACEYSSCMGRYLYLDEQNNVYFCREKRDGSRMYALPLDSDKKLYRGCYNEVLQRIIKKREACLASCQDYGLCRGGCPLAAENENCADYLQNAAFTAAFLEKEMATRFAELPNPCIRQFYLRMIAFGYQVPE